jgi:hypothetical protein
VPPVARGRRACVGEIAGASDRLDWRASALPLSDLLVSSTDCTMRFSSYLVPGGAGFIGSHLCERLLAAGHEVHVVDDLSSGDVDNLARLRSHRRFSFTKSDIVLPAPQSFEGAEAIFNLACPASPPQY